MRGFDAFAGVIKSGGKTRRAAKMVILNVDHPDIVEFIRCKAKEEKKAWALIDAGYDGSFNGEAYESVFFQNSNNSVRVTDDFMEAVVEDRQLDDPRGRATAAPWRRSRRATCCGRSPRRPGSAATRACSSTPRSTPGTPARTRRASTRRNPCSEYMFLDDSACNLASLNLMHFRTHRRRVRRRVVPARGGRDAPGAGDHRRQRASTRRRRSSENSHDFRPLGLGYANLGALLMSRGLPYDSDAGPRLRRRPSPR